MLSAPELGSMVTSCSGQGLRGAGREVGQRVTLEVPPEHLDRVDLGSIGWKEEAVEFGRASEDPGYQLGAMGEGAVPYDEDGLLHLSAKGPQKAGHARGRDVPLGMETKVKSYPLAVWRHRQGRDGGNLPMASAHLVEQWRLSARGPSAPNQRREQEPAFVDKCDIGVQSAGFFLMRGHSTLIQCRMAFSSRSRARRSGFCGLQPIERRSLGR